MTQRIFDTDNEEDMKLLWSILPDKIVRIFLEQIECFDRPRTMVECLDTQKDFFTSLIAIDWHDKTEITRPVQEATEADIGKICYFWEGKDFAIGVLAGIGDNLSPDIYRMEDGKGGIWYVHCRRLTKQEIEELC